MTTRFDADVRDEFDHTASRYDLMVALNPGYHRHLRTAARSLAALLPASSHPALLDAGCGSGASTRALVEVIDAGSVVGIDSSAGMLAQARSKRWPAGVRFEQRAAADLGDPGSPGPVDGILAAYLIRNVAESDRDEVVDRLYGSLGDGGGLVVVEYSVRGNRRAAAMWTAVCWSVVIPLSALLTRRTRLYQYLWRSVLSFDTVDTLTDRLRRAGFVDVRASTVGGWQRGILHIVSARRGV